MCTWNRGSDTFLTSGSSLWWVCQTSSNARTSTSSLMTFARVCFRVRTLSGEHTSGPVTYGISRKGPDFLSAGLAMSGSVQRISVWVESRNILGSAESVLVNYTLSDIGETVKTGALFSPSLSLSFRCVMRNTRFPKQRCHRLQSSRPPPAPLRSVSSQ